MSNNPSQPSGAELQGKPQETPGNLPAKASADVPIYTEAQLQEKIKEEQSKIRKGESERYKNLETENRELKAANSALELQVEDVKVLKAQITELDELKTEGLPKEAKDYLKLKATLTEERIRGKSELDSLKTRLATYETDNKNTLVERLAERTGMKREMLSKLPLEHLKSLDADIPEQKKEAKTEPPADTKQLPATEGQQPPVTNDGKMPPPELGGTPGSGLSDADFWKAYGQPGFNPAPADNARAQQIYNRALSGG